MSAYADHDVPVIVRGRGPVGVGQPGPALPRRPVGAVRGAGRARPAGAGRGGGPPGRASWPTSRCGATPTPTPSSCPSGWPPWRPGTLNRVFFTTGGGEAVESAWKLARQYFRATGQPGRYKVLSRDIAYHGTTMGALSITGLPAIKEPFEPLVPGSVRVANTNFYRAPEHGDDLEAFGRLGRRRHRAAHRDGRARTRWPPCSSSRCRTPGGCFPPPPGYFQRVREICDRHGVLLVSDEVICAFGRLGRLVRSGPLRLPARHDHLRQGHDERLLPARRPARRRPAHGAVPRRHGDLLPRLHLRRPSGVDRGGPGQPRSVREGGPGRRGGGPGRRRSGPCSRGCGTCPIVGDVRGDGFFYGIELVKDKDTRETFDDDESERLLRGFLSGALFDAGLICRADDRGDPVIQLAPPLICEQEHFDLIGEILRSVLSEAWTRL